MITIKLPVVVDADVLRKAMEAAHACNTSLRIDTFFRIRLDDEMHVDCDSEREVREYAAHAMRKGIDVGPWRAAVERLATNESAKAADAVDQQKS